MTLVEKLRERAAFQGRTAQVECGGLGSLTVEALSVRDIDLLTRGPDGARNVLYAACRELQHAGEELRQAGQIYKPDEILQFVSDSEAETAARTVLELSGWENSNHVYSSLRTDGLDENHVDPPLTTDGTEAAGKASVARETDAVRLLSVQNAEEDLSEIRPANVQYTSDGTTQDGQDRPESVQFLWEAAPEIGQDSRETRPETADFSKIPKSDTKTQPMGDSSPERTQNVVSGFSETRTEAYRTSRGTMPLHETKSELRDGLHETESELMHETKSDFRGNRATDLHETESEFFGERPSAGLAEGQSLHEIRSELQKILHETESELGEIFARQMLEGLRRAKWVRGG